MILDSTSLITIETLFVVVSGLFLIFYVGKLRSVIIQERTAGEIISSIVNSLEKKIYEKDERIGDLLFRIDLLESKMISSTRKQIKTESVVGEPPRVIPFNVMASDVTSTEITVLRLLLNGAKPPKEIQKELGKSREHVTRLMKRLFEKGYVSRNQNERPFVYDLTNAGKDLIIGSR